MFQNGTNKAIKTIVGAVSNLNDEYIKIYKFKRKSPFSLIDTTSLDHANYFSSKMSNEYEEKIVKNHHINNIFTEVGKVNVLNIDIEGKDIDVIKSSDLKIIDPEIILIEDNSGYFPSKDLINFFSNKNYYLISICGLTKCFAKM